MAQPPDRRKQFQAAYAARSRREGKKQQLHDETVPVPRTCWTATGPELFAREAFLEHDIETSKTADAFLQNLAKRKAASEAAAMGSKTSLTKYETMLTGQLLARTTYA